MPEKRKVDFESPTAKKPKRENQAKIQPRAVKKPQKKQTKSKPTQKQKKKPSKRTSQQTKGQSKAKPKKPKSPLQEFSDEEEFNFEHVDMSSEDEVEWANSVYSEPVIIPRPRHCNGFGPRYVY